jgi:uncharacterized membrane protein YkvA (DUF1232 family)
VTTPRWHVALSVVGGLVLVWLLMVGALLLAARRSPGRVMAEDVFRLVPDVVRLLRRLAVDPTLPRSCRWRVWLLVAYLAMPVDLVPDFLPVVGYADDVILVALVLRSVTRAAGRGALERHWPGTPAGLAAIHRLVGLEERRR